VEHGGNLAANGSLAQRGVDGFTFLMSDNSAKPGSSSSALIAHGANELALEPTPVLGAAIDPDDVALTLVLAQISPLDRQVVAGQFPPAKPWPLIPGTSAVARDDEGNFYFAFAESAGGGTFRDGSHADRFVLPRSVLYSIPTGSDYAAIAASVTSLATAHSILKDIAQARAGQTLLILGANGSVGRASIAVGRALGLTMAAASRDGLDIDGVAGVRNDFLAEDAKRALGRGADIIIDPIAGSVTGAAISAAGPDCHHILIGFSAGALMPIIAPRFLGGEHRLIGFNLLRRPEGVLAEHVRSAIAEILQGEYAPDIDSIVPLNDGVAGYVRAGEVRGRVLLKGSLVGRSVSEVFQ
jgi:NADPH2:quinone reductase